MSIKCWELAKPKYSILSYRNDNLQVSKSVNLPQKVAARGRGGVGLRGEGEHDQLSQHRWRLVILVSQSQISHLH